MAEPHEAKIINRNYDELEQALAARPLLRAPRHTSQAVLARIAALSPAENVTRPEAIRSVARYAPPPVLPLSVPAVSEPPVEEAGPPPRLLFGLIFTGAWSGLCLFVLWLVWPAIANLFFGPSSDPEMQARLAFLQSGWDGLTNLLADLLHAYEPLWPSLLSATVGLALMWAVLYRTGFRRNFTT